MFVSTFTRSFYMKNPLHKVNTVRMNHYSIETKTGTASKSVFLSPQFPVEKKLEPSLTFSKQTEESENDFKKLLCNARNNDPQSMYILAFCYFEGYRVEKNTSKALELLHKAAKNYPPALNELGLLYLNVSNTKNVLKPNIPLGATCVIMAANQGFTSAIMNLGTLYESGHGVKQNLSVALKNYERAKELGLEDDDLDISIARVKDIINLGGIIQK